MRDYRQKGVLLTLILLAPVAAWANSIIPSPLIWQGVFMGPDSIIRYLLSVTLICVGVEAAIYKYHLQFQHPMRDSIVANLVSTVVGIPAGFFSAMAEEPFLIATTLTIAVEVIVIRKMENKRSIVWPVIWANLVSNVMIMTLLIWKSSE